MKHKLLILTAVAACLAATTCKLRASDGDYAFDGKISRQVLENYLSRSITFAEVLNGEWVEKHLQGSTEDNIRMMANIGVEAIHFGQVEIMDDRDTDHIGWRDMMVRVRRYAARKARRHILIADAHVPSAFGQEETIKQIWTQHTE